jgi:hypothetical protein
MFCFYWFLVDVDLVGYILFPVSGIGARVFGVTGRMGFDAATAWWFDGV